MAENTGSAARFYLTLTRQPMVPPKQLRKVAVNGKSLGRAQPGGAVRAAIRLLGEIGRQMPAVSFSVFMPLHRPGDVEITDWPPNVSVIVSASRLNRSAVIRALWEQIILPYKVKKSGHRILLNMTNTAPVILTSTIKQMLIVHDAGYMNKDWFSSFFARYTEWCVKRCASQGTILVTVSEASAQDLRPHLSDGATLFVIHNGADNPPETIDSVPRINIPQEFILFIGSLNPRKNLQGLLEGFAEYGRDSADHQTSLVIIGAEKPIFKAQSAPTSDTDAGVIFLGYVTEAEKWSLLEGARILILPSFLEGFGLPIVEAMRMGTPVIASDIPVHRELFEGAVMFIDPRKPQQMALAITKLIEDDVQRTKLIERGKICAQKFTWSTAAEKYLEVINTMFTKMDQIGAAG